jgi:predicted enzyme related to lactoylglutathione lyase
MNGTVVCFELTTPDTTAAERFYTQLLGWTTERYDMQGMPYTMWSAGGRSFGGMTPLQDEQKKMGVPPNWTGYVGVENVDAAVNRCRELGGQVHLPGTDIPNMGRFAILADPDGAAFAVYGESPAPPPAGEPPKPAVDWHELMTSDLDKAWAFYEQMFGWSKTEAMDMGPEMGVYQMFGKGGNTIGGMMRRNNEVPHSFWGYYFHTDDVTATAEKARSLGAQHIHTTEVPGGTWVSIFTDPQGAYFGIHGPKGG